jgi:hypothetical protein
MLPILWIEVTTTPKENRGDAVGRYSNQPPLGLELLRGLIAGDAMRLRRSGPIDASYLDFKIE